jgi:hypothetical protein
MIRAIIHLELGLRYQIQFEFEGKKQIHDLVEGENRLGNAKNLEIKIDFPGVDSEHALIMVEDEGCWIQDLESEGKTYVNGRPIEGSVWLQDGDQLDFGPHFHAKIKLDLKSKKKDAKSGRTQAMREPQPKSRGLAKFWPEGKTRIAFIFGIGLVLLVFVLRLRGPNTTELYSGATDLFAAQSLNNELNSLGISGADAIVIPIKGEAGQVAIISLDANSSVAGDQENKIDAIINGIVSTNQSENLGISQVAFNYTDEDGQSLITVGVDEQTLASYSAGLITREEMLARTEADFSNLIEAFQQISETGAH